MKEYRNTCLHATTRRRTGQQLRHEAKGRCPQCRSRPEQTGSIQNCVHYHEEVGLAGLYMADNVSVLRDKQAALRYAREQGCALICPGARPKMTAGNGVSSYDLRRRSPTTSF